MRVVSVSIPYPSPGQSYSGLFVQRRLEALARRIDLEVISPQPWFPWLRPVPVPCQSKAEEFPPASRPRMFYLPGMLKGLDGLWLRNCLLTELPHVRRGRPIDVIDAHFEYPEGVGAVLAARRVGLPIFVTLRGLLTKYLKSPSRRSQCLTALRDATGIISVAHSLKRTAESHGIDGSKIRVIPNAIDNRTFSVGCRSEARASLGIAQDDSLIVSVGHLQSIKGQHDLVRALARTDSRGGQVRLMLIGNAQYDLQYTRSIRRLITELELGAKVDLLGQQPPDRVAQWLRAANLFVLPTYHEGCCNAVLEALACGTPVVTTPVGDNADYVDDTRGQIVPVGDVSALAAAITVALGRVWSSAEIAAPVASRTWDHAAQEILDFFHERLEMRLSSHAQPHHRA